MSNETDFDPDSIYLEDEKNPIEEDSSSRKILNFVLLKQKTTDTMTNNVGYRHTEITEACTVLMYSLRKLNVLVYSSK